MLCSQHYVSALVLIDYRPSNGIPFMPGLKSQDKNLTSACLSMASPLCVRWPRTSAARTRLNPNPITLNARRFAPSCRAPRPWLLARSTPQFISVLGHVRSSSAQIRSFRNISDPLQGFTNLSPRPKAEIPVPARQVSAPACIICLAAFGPIIMPLSIHWLKRLVTRAMEGRPLASKLMYREADYGILPMPMLLINDHGPSCGMLMDRQLSADTQSLQDSRRDWVEPQESELDLHQLQNYGRPVRGRCNEEDSQIQLSQSCQSALLPHILQACSRP